MCEDDMCLQSQHLENQEFKSSLRNIKNEINTKPHTNKTKT